MVDVNVNSLYHVTRAVLPGMVEWQMVDTPPYTLQFIVEVRPLSPKRRRDGSARG